jgi:UDP-N-acetylglucosamine acyltransferase
MVEIHPTALIHPGARLGANVTVGAYSIIGEHVEIGDHCQIGPHVVITGHTRIGSGNRIFQFVSLGEEPQDKNTPASRHGWKSATTTSSASSAPSIPARFRMPASPASAMTTGSWPMFTSRTIASSAITSFLPTTPRLAGHVTVHDYAILGGFTGVHQFCRIGAHVITGIASVIRQDVPPYVTVCRQPGGAAWHQFGRSEATRLQPGAVSAIKRAYKTFTNPGLA